MIVVVVPAAPCDRANRVMLLLNLSNFFCC